MNNFEPMRKKNTTFYRYMLLDSTEKFIRRNRMPFKKFLIWERFMDKKGEGVS